MMDADPAQSRMPTPQSAAATIQAPPITSAWLPSTQVAATLVKNPGARP